MRSGGGTSAGSVFTRSAGGAGGAGSTPAEITAFAEAIHGWPNERLLTELSLADAITSG